jgi:ATP-dependent helicase/nuclease subunit B
VHVESEQITTTLEPASNPPLELLIGPAGSGKTRAAVNRALECAKRGERVIVLTLPNQRAQFLERLAANGPSLGVEVTNLQNIAYRLLDRLGENRPVVLNPGRVALTARILERHLERSVGPGEARLYARAVAECKRFGYVPQTSGEPYQDTLAQVYSGYEAALIASDLQDLDDVRLRLTELLETLSFQPESLEPVPTKSAAIELGAHLIVDGYRSFNPSELEVICALASIARSSLITLPAGSPDTHLEAWAHPLRPAEIRAIGSRLNASVKRLNGAGKPWAGLPKTVRLETYSNPVDEARATLRQIKTLMHTGTRAQDIAIVIPNPVFVRVLEALGREYSVPIAPETQGGALETHDGRKLEALLAAPARDYPVRELRALSGLEPDLSTLADALEQAGVAAGSSAYPLVCFDQDALDALERVRVIAQPPETGTAAELVAWFETLLERFMRDAPFAESARVIAREAARILEPTAQTSMSGAGFTDWLRNLLSSLQVTHPDAGRGVAVVTAEEISGRRFDHVFVIGATDGAYKSGEGEDFFVPEEQRDSLEQLLRLIPGLPEKLNGLEDSAFFDIVTRANLGLYISHPRAERGASLRPHPRLAQLGTGTARTSEPPSTASTLELAAASQHLSAPPRADWKIKPRASLRANDLERAAQCNLRSWADTVLPAPARASGLVTDELLRSWGSKMRRAKWKGEDTKALEAVPEEHKDRLASLASGFRSRLEQVIESRVPGQPGVDVQLGYRANLDGIEFTLDGVRFKRDPSGQIRSTEIFRVLEDANDGYSQFMNPDRQREWWFAHAMSGRGSIVTFWAWDLNNQPKFVMNLEKPYAQRRLAESLVALEETKRALETGNITANPGFHCRLCAQRDVCREAV